jgi:regulator of sirC expression with transglutaminase-like and TPR domain
MRKPKHCKTRAYNRFAKHLTEVDTTDGLLHSAIAISMHALEGVDSRQIDRQLSQLARRVRRRVRGRQKQALLAHLHEVLFEEQRFRGNENDYYHPLNSYIPAVLESRQGIPITLSLIYKVVAERVGIAVEGINSPGHFLTRVYGDGEPMIVDVYRSGRVLTRDEAFDQIERSLQRSTVRDDSLLVTATNRQWLSRLLNNLQTIFANEGRQNDLDAMSELQALLVESLA